MPLESEPISLDREALYTSVTEALNDFHELRCEESPLAHLFLFRITRRDSTRALRSLTNQLLTDACELLEQNAPEDALFIQRRFFDRESMAALCQRMNVSEGHIYTIRKRAIFALTDILIAQETASRGLQQQQWEERLATPTYDQLFGIEAHVQKLLALVSSMDVADLLVLEGIGGIGKTSLADALIRRLMGNHDFDDFGWVSLKTQQLTPQGFITPTTSTNAALTGQNGSSTDGDADAVIRSLLYQLAPDFPVTASMETAQCLQVLTERLKSARHFIVIDNVEELEEARAILPVLERLMNPTRFLITSRIRLPANHTVYSYTVSPLSLQDGLRLVRREAMRSNLLHLSKSADADLERIYAVVGGNPLALRLVVGLAHTLELSHILDGLQSAPTAKAEELYRYIYQQAWEQLGELAATVLIYMPIAETNGDPLHRIVNGVGLPKMDVQTGLDQLVDLNLVNVHQNAAGYRYSIHNLTRSFLLNEAIDW